MKNLHKRQSGLSLIEIMVALVISLFLLGGIVQVYLGNKTAYRFSDASARVQENGRFALETIANDIRMAGFWGCYGFRGDNETSFHNHLDFTKGAAFDFIDQPAVEATNTAGDWTTTDTLTIRGARPGQTTLTADLDPLTDPVVVSTPNSFSVDDIVLMTNCWSANIFQITAISDDRTTIRHGQGGTGVPGNSSADVKQSVAQQPYSANSAAIYRLQEVTYSIDVSASGSGEPALFRNRNNNNVELLEGIENFQILLGEDTDGDESPNQYVGRDAVRNLQDVTAVRLWLVVRSEQDFVVDAVQPYTINGIQVTPADQRFRQVFSTTIALRSKAG